MATRFPDIPSAEKNKGQKASPAKGQQSNTGNQTARADTGQELIKMEYTAPVPVHQQSKLRPPALPLPGQGSTGEDDKSEDISAQEDQMTNFQTAGTARSNEPGLKRQVTAQDLENELKSQGACGKNCVWIVCCLLAGFMMGTGAFLYASNFSEYGLAGSGVLGPGAFVAFLFMKVFREVRFRWRTNSWTKPFGSSWQDGGRIRWSSLIPLLGNMAATIGYTIVMTFAWRFAEQGGLNQGVISSLLSFASVINCVVFYCAFGEKVSKLHLIGVAFMFCGIACIGAAAATSEEDSLNEDLDTGGRSPLLNGVLALVVGFGGPIVISTQHYIIRKFSKFYTGLDQAIDAAPPQNLIFCFFLIPLADKMSIEWSDILIGFAAEGLMETARILLSFGVEKGLAGPAQALMSTHALWQALCGAAFADQALTGLQIAGILLGLVGVFSISYFDHLANKVVLKRQLSRMRTLELEDQKKKESSSAPQSQPTLN